jgi:hypothetical protein
MRRRYTVKKLAPLHPGCHILITILEALTAQTMAVMRPQQSIPWAESPRLHRKASGVKNALGTGKLRCSPAATPPQLDP